jgi:hypothetical protein
VIGSNELITTFEDLENSIYEVTHEDAEAIDDDSVVVPASAIQSRRQAAAALLVWFEDQPVIAGSRSASPHDVKADCSAVDLRVKRR